jgi:glucose-1-phosphate thymidylyltransferase
VRLVEKPREPISNLAVIGIYYVRNMADLFTAIEEQMRRGLALKNEYYIADAIQLMIDNGAKVISRPVRIWEDCGNADALLSSNRSDLQRHHPPIREHEGSVIIAPSFVAEDATVIDSIIGPFASIGTGAVIRDSIVRDSIVEAKAEICGAMLEQSIVGRRASVHGFRGRLNVGDDAVVGR